MENTFEPLKLNLQFFANEEGQDEQGATNDEGEEDTPKQTEEKEMGKDSSLNEEAVKTLLDQLLEERAKEEEKKKDEEKRLASLSKAERELEIIKKRELELKEKEGQFLKEQLMTDAKAELKNNELPLEFADYVLGKDAEETFANIKLFKTKFDEAVEESVKKSLRQDTPNTPTSSANRTLYGHDDEELDIDVLKYLK